MVQVLKSTKSFELFGGLNPGTVRVSTKNSKAQVMLARCAVFSPAKITYSPPPESSHSEPHKAEPHSY
jgi:hypothetical protein